MNIMATFACDKECSFCNLQMYRNKLKGIVDLGFLERVLSKYPHIFKEANIMGGNPFLLPEQHLNDLVDLCLEYLGEGNVDIFATLSVPVTKVRNIEKLNVHVSYDPMDRKNPTQTLNEMLALECDYDIHMVATNHLINDFGAKRIRHLARMTGKHIELSEYQNSVGNDWSLRPSPEDMARFIEDLQENGHDNIHLKMLRKPDPNFFDDPVQAFDQRTSLYPDNRFAVGWNGKYKHFTDVKDGLQRFEAMYHEAGICKSCAHRQECMKVYCTNTKCSYDRELMEVLHGHHSDV